MGGGAGAACVPRAGLSQLVSCSPSNTLWDAWNCRQPSQANEVQGLENVTLTQLDVSSPQSVEQWAGEVQKLASHFDYVINNAGIYGRRVGLSDVTYDDMLATFVTNCVGPLLVVQQLHK